MWLKLRKIEAISSGKGEGVTIESKLMQRGPTATVIITQGDKRRNFIGTNSVTGKVKTFESFDGKHLEEAFSGDPVSISGFSEVPAGRGC